MQLESDSVSGSSVSGPVSDFSVFDELRLFIVYNTQWVNILCIIVIIITIIHNN